MSLFRTGANASPEMADVGDIAGEFDRVARGAARGPPAAPQESAETAGFDRRFKSASNTSNV
jgi:hypothetical protein